jgi:Protein of unknwon function (DUF3310)
MILRGPLTAEELGEIPNGTRVARRQKGSSEEPYHCFLRWDGPTPCLAVFNPATMENDHVILRLTPERFDRLDIWEVRAKTMSEQVGDDLEQQVVDELLEVGGAVRHPSHYNACGETDEDGSVKYEPIKVIEAWGFGEGFCAGNAIKYILRAPHKGTEREDLEKALWYLDRLVDCDYRPEPGGPRRRYQATKVSKAWNLTATRQELAKVIEYIAIGLYGSASIELRAWLGYGRMAEEIAEVVDAEILEDLKQKLGGGGE